MWSLVVCAVVLGQLVGAQVCELNVNTQGRMQSASTFTLGGAGNSFTVCARIYALSATSDENLALSHGVESTSNGLYFGYWSGGSFYLGFWSNNLVYSSTPTPQAQNNGVWQHWCGVVNGANSVRYLYRNGVQVASSGFSTAYGPQTTTLKIGSRPGYGSTSNMKIDNVRVYTRALDVTEVAELSNGQYTNLNNLVVAYDFNDNGNTATDRSCNNNNAAFAGTSSFTCTEAATCGCNGVNCDGSCTDGTQNDPTVALPPPVLASVSIASNNYNVVLNVDKRFRSVATTFDGGASSCNYDSLTGDTAAWTSDNTDNCLSVKTYSHSAQDTLATCGFVRSSSPVGGYYQYDTTLYVRTTQTRTISHTQSLRNQTYSEVKTTQFLLRVQVPVSATVSSTTREVTGNVSVLQAITNSDITVGDPNYKVSFSLLTSTQAPYKLTYTSFSSPAALGNTITVNAPDCADTAATTPCWQTFDFSNLDIVTPCPTKNQLSDTINVTFSVGCKPSFEGNCVTPSPDEITVTFSLTSTDYCPRTNGVSLSAVLQTYRDVSLTSTSAWDASSLSTQYVIGSTLYGQAVVTVGEGAATLSSTKITRITTIGPFNRAVTVYTAQAGVVNTGTFTGAQLSDKVTNGQASFGAADISSVSGSTLTLSGDNSGITIVYRMNIIEAGSLDTSQPLVVEFVVDFTASSSDQDPVWAITDGTNAFGAGIGDNTPNAWGFSGAVSGNLITGSSYPDLGSFARTMPITITITAQHFGTMSVVVKNAVGATRSWSTNINLDLTKAIDALIVCNENGEVYPIHSMGVSVQGYSAGEGGTLVENGDVLTGGSVNFPDDHDRARFAIPLIHTTTVDLNATTDVEQEVTVEVVLETTYSVSSAGANSRLMKEWHDKHHGQSRMVGLFSERDTRAITAQFSVASTAGGNSAGGASSSSSGVASMSVMTVAAVGGVIALLVIVVAYRMGGRHNDKLEDQQESLELHVPGDTSVSSQGSTQLTKSSSAVDIAVE